MLVTNDTPSTPTRNDTRHANTSNVSRLMPHDDETVLVRNTTSATQQPTINHKILRGIHAPPKSMPSSSKYLWDDDEIVSPPESVNRSINFDKLRQSGSSWPFRFMNEEDDLIFNRRTPVSSPLKSFPFAASASPNTQHLRNAGGVVGDSSSPEIFRRRVPLPALRNIAPAGLGQFDYHLGVSNGSSRIRSVLRNAMTWPLSFLISLAQRCIGNKKRACVFSLLAFIMFGIIVSSTMGSSQPSDPSANTVTSDENESKETQSDRKILFIDPILESNVTCMEDLVNKYSPQYAALTWISEEDDMHLDPLHRDVVARYAFATLYFSISSWFSGDEFNNFHLTWLSNRHVCDWEGITCSNDYYPEVKRFQFDAGRVNGPLVPEILATFQKLEVLHMSGIGLNGPLPSNLGLLQELKVLSLGDNNFTGSIPSELGMMSSLQLLGLHNNTLESELANEIWNLTQLSALYLDGNNLRGTIPREVEKLTELVDFRLRYNDMGGTLPASSLTSLTKLKILYLDSNNFTGPMPTEIGELQSLESLFIQNNKLESSIPLEVGNLNSLIHFIADNNNFTGELPSQLLELSRLEKLWLTGNKLNSFMPPEACDGKNIFLEIKVDCSLSCVCCGGCD